jgi:hypothetical protein
MINRLASSSKHDNRLYLYFPPQTRWKYPYGHIKENKLVDLKTNEIITGAWMSSNMLPTNEKNRAA